MSKKYRVRLPKRIRLDWNPQWEPEISGMTYNYLRKNIWRCEEIHSLEDLMQDAYLIFMKLCDYYPRVVEGAHFMSLYKRSLANMITDKARIKKYKSEIIDDVAVFEEPKYAESNTLNLQVRNSVTPTTFNDGLLYALIEQSSPELKMFFDLFNDEEKLKELRKTRTKKLEPRLNFNQKVSKILGIENFPFRKAILELLSN